jgi:hypothetical protein
MECKKFRSSGAEGGTTGAFGRGTCHQSPKRAIRRPFDDVPDNDSLEDIQYHIYVCEKIERGMRDVEAGRVVDQDEAKRRMAKWLGSMPGE